MDSRCMSTSAMMKTARGAVIGRLRQFRPTDDFLASWLGLALLFAWTFSLFFHLCNGIRHLFWDVGYGFDLQAIYASGWAVVAVSIGLTLTAWIISFGMKG
jgi:succinate dehydrogenase / fumarate reductase cytochrome b subunit